MDEGHKLVNNRLTKEDEEEVVRCYKKDGYYIARGVFTPDDVKKMQERFDVWYQENLKHHATYIKQNQRVWIGNRRNGERYVRGMQWPSYTDPVLDTYRLHPRLLAYVIPLLGEDLKQIINQMHWKTPGANVTWRHHQDVRSRKPDEAYRDLASSYLQTGIALDHHHSGTGAMQIIPGSHKLGDLHIEETAKAHPKLADPYDPDPNTGLELLRISGADPAKLIDVELQPGDIAMWSPLTVHGGGLNTSIDCYRRFYINGFVKASNCDCGEMVLVDGICQELGTPAFIQLDSYDKPDGFYVEDDERAVVRD